MTYVRPELAWPIVTVVGGGLVAAALAVDLVGGDGALVLMTLFWPLSPGLITVDAARRGLRVRPGFLP